jgi:hypothetical protein
VCKDKWWDSHLKGNHYGTSLLSVITLISAQEITLKLLVLHWEPVFWLGPAKMKSLLLPSKSSCHSVPLKDTHCLCKGMPWKQWVPVTFSSWQKAIGEERELCPGKREIWAGLSRVSPVNWDFQPDPMLKMLRLPTSLLTPGSPQVGKRTQRLSGPPIN